MIKATLATLAQQLNVSPPAQFTDFSGISTDTRTITPGNLYIAIRGEQFDGHQFVAEAAKKGAAAALVSEKVAIDLPQLIVDDTILALGKIAGQWRDQFALPLIGVTGSNGKTTLKNMIAAILRAACDNQAEKVLATEGNLNNNIGLPLNLARLNAQHRYAVIEMGMNHFGEIEYLTKIAKPTVAVINNAAAAHLEGLGSVAGVAKAKGEIFFGLAADGVAVLNRDDEYFDYWRGLIGNRRYLSFGFNDADITTQHIENQPLQVKTPQGDITIKLPLIGKHNTINALAATACALAAGIALPAIKAGLENVQPAPGRMRQYQLANNVRVIDDTYNANPLSLQAAINTLATFSSKKILAMGDMRELGENAAQLHFEMGEKAKAAGIDYLFTFGSLSEQTSKAFGKNAQHFSDKEKLVMALMPYLEKDVTVLVKGSRSMQMEKVIAGIIPLTNDF